MKKLFIIVGSALAIASCTNNNDSNVDNQQAEANKIDFRVVTDKTRATVTTGGNIHNFSVLANIAGETGESFKFMNNMPVVKSIGASTWTYAPAKYYPGGTKLVEFFGYSPASSANISQILYDAGKASITYTVPTSTVDGSKTPEDFLVAYDKKGSGAVSMSFKHALSLIRFAAKNTSNDVTFVVSGVEMLNFVNSGSIDVTTTPLWKDISLYNKTYSVSLPDAGVSIKPKTSTFTNLISKNEGMMLFPQNILGPQVGSFKGVKYPGDTPPTDVNTKSYVVVTYNAYDGYGDVLFTGAKYYLPIEKNFEMTNSYTLQFTFVNPTEIAFDVNVGDWLSSPAQEIP